jgi:hypothetical protein
MKCSKCQTPLTNGKLFCPNCGYLNDSQPKPLIDLSEHQQSYPFNKLPVWWYLYAIIFSISGIINTFLVRSILSDTGIYRYPIIEALTNLINLHAIGSSWSGTAIFISGILSLISTVLLISRKRLAALFIFANLIVGTIVAIILLIDWQFANSFLAPFSLYICINALWFIYFLKQRPLLK